MKIINGLAAAFVVVAATPASAQDLSAGTVAAPVADQKSSSPQMEVASGSTSTSSADVAAAPAASPEPVCELHVWPTQNYLGVNSGLLSGFGALGAVADMAVHADRVKTVKELMGEYLGPDVQVEELTKARLTDALKLRNYRVVIEEPTPFNEDLKNNPVLKEKVRAMNERVKSKRRLTESKSPCYAELITSYIFYHKAMMYGSNLFTFWTFRDFGDKPFATRVAKGQVKNPLEEFPPKDTAKVGAAKLELRDAFSKDFVEWVQKKAMP